MIHILTTVMPVIAMLFVGWLCRQRKWVSREGVDNIKFLVTKILLPIAIFNALSTAGLPAGTDDCRCAVRHEPNPGQRYYPGYCRHLLYVGTSNFQHAVVFER